MITSRLGLAALFSAALLSSSYALAADEKPDYSASLTGNWGGTRDSLYQKGVSFDAVYKFDVWRNFSGGIETGNAALDNLDVQMTIDGSKLYGLDGSTIFVYLLNNNGGQPNGKKVGSNGGIDKYRSR